MYYVDVLGGIVDLGERIIRRGERSEQWQGGDSCLWGSRPDSFPFFLSYLYVPSLFTSFSFFPIQKRVRSLCLLAINTLQTL